jgi:type I restriction enzyme S subunit
MPMESRKPTGNYFKYIDIESIDNKHQTIKGTKIVETAKAPSRASRAVFDGSILFSLVRPYLKNIALVGQVDANSIASTGFYIATSNGTYIPQYLYILMISSYVVDGLNQFMKGDNSPSINKDNIERWLYPVPPLAEQKNIADQVQKYISMLEKIEKSLS